NILRAVAEACNGRFDGNAGAPPRIEARDKVTGSAKYTVDVRHEGQLEGLIVRSHVGHSRVASIDLAPARAMPGAKRILPPFSSDQAGKEQPTYRKARLRRRPGGKMCAAPPPRFRTSPG